MSVSVAQLNYNVFQGLGQPDVALCDLNDIHYATRNALSLLTGQSRASDNNQLLCVTNEISSATTPPLDTPYDITYELEQTTPAWVEIKRGTRWEILKIVPKPMLEQYYQLQNPACSFYGLDQDGTSVQYIEFSFDPTADTIRIWFDQDAVSVGLDDLALIPDNLTILTELMAQNRVIMIVKSKLASQIESEDMRKILEIQLRTWSELYIHNTIEIQDWQRQFRIWKNRTRSAQSIRHLPRRSGKGLYGG